MRREPPHEHISKPAGFHESALGSPQALCLAMVAELTRSSHLCREGELNATIKSTTMTQSIITTVLTFNAGVFVGAFLMHRFVFVPFKKRADKMAKKALHVGQLAAIVVGGGFPNITISKGTSRIDGPVPSFIQREDLDIGDN